MSLYKELVEEYKELTQHINKANRFYPDASRADKKVLRREIQSCGNRRRTINQILLAYYSLLIAENRSFISHASL